MSQCCPWCPQSANNQATAAGSRKTSHQGKGAVSCQEEVKNVSMLPLMSSICKQPGNGSRQQEDITSGQGCCLLPGRGEECLNVASDVLNLQQPSNGSGQQKGSQQGETSHQVKASHQSNILHKGKAFHQANV